MKYIPTCSQNLYPVLRVSDCTLRFVHSFSSPATLLPERILTWYSLPNFPSFYFYFFLSLTFHPLTPFLVLISFSSLRSVLFFAPPSQEYNINISSCFQHPLFSLAFTSTSNMRLVLPAVYFPHLFLPTLKFSFSFLTYIIVSLHLTSLFLIESYMFPSFQASYKMPYNRSKK